MEHTHFTYEAWENSLIIHMPREIDHHNCRNMKRDTDLLLEENYINCIVFDFTHTEFMDSSGVGILLNRYKQMHASRGLTNILSSKNVEGEGCILRRRTAGKADS